MVRYLSRTLAAVAVLALPGALAAQEQHGFFIGVYGGGASHLTLFFGIDGFGRMTVVCCLAGSYLDKT